MVKSLVGLVSVALLGCLVGGCNTGSHSGAKGSFLDPAFVASRAVGLRAVAIPTGLTAGVAATSTTALVLFSDRSLQGPRVFVDTGLGFRDSGQAPVVAGSALLFEVPVTTGARLQVRGLQSGAGAASNTIVVGPLSVVAQAIQVVRPVGSSIDLGAPVRPPVTDAAWSSAQVASHLVLAWRVEQQSFSGGSVIASFDYPEAIVEVPGTQSIHRFGDRPLATYAAGRDPRQSGRWRVNVLGLDVTGWATSTSDAQYFEVR